MKQKLRRLALGVLFGMLALCALSLQAGAAETAFTDQALEGIALPKVLGSQTFSWEGSGLSPRDDSALCVRAL